MNFNKDNLTPPGPVEDNRDKAPTSTKGNKTPVTKPASHRSTAIKQSDHLKMEGELRTTRKKFATSGERAEIVKYLDNLQPEGQFELPDSSKIKKAVLLSSLFWQKFPGN